MPDEGSVGRVVIVGASTAGLAVADGLREGSYVGEVVLLSAEDRTPYDRPSLSKALLLAPGDATATPPLVPLRTPEHLAEHRYDVRLGVSASGLDPVHRVVATRGPAAVESSLPFDDLVVATGATARTLTTSAGVALPTLREASDLMRLRDAATSYPEATLIGAGLIGLEVAAALVERGVRVTVIEAAASPLEAVLGGDIAARLVALHRSHGVDVRTNTHIERIDGAEGDYTLTFADGSAHRTPYLLAGIGVVPATGWLEGSGVPRDPRSGAVVTGVDGLAGVPHVWAVGDVAAFPQPGWRGPRVIPHFTSAVDRGRHVGRAIAARTSVDPATEAGRDRPPTKTDVPYLWTDQYDRHLHVFGLRRPGDLTVMADGALDSPQFVALVGDGQHLHAVIASGLPRSLRAYKRLLEQGATWDDALAARQADATDLT